MQIELYIYGNDYGFSFSFFNNLVTSFCKSWDIFPAARMYCTRNTSIGLCGDKKHCWFEIRES